MKVLQICFITLLIFSAGCISEQLDINEDPNNPIDVPIQMMLPNISINLADTYTGSLHFTTMIVQQIEGQGRCGILNAYTGLIPVRVNDIWQNYYENILNEIQKGKIKAEQKNLNHHKGILLTTEAFALLTLTDYFDDIPYSESFKGISSPKFDNQNQIIEVVFSNLKEASELFEGPVGDVVPGAEDLFFQGDISKWKKTIHGIKARAFLHLGNYAEALSEANSAMESNEDDLNFQYDGGDNGAAWYYRFNRDRTGDLEFHPQMRIMLEDLNDLDRLDIWNKIFRTTHPFFVDDQVVELITYREMEFIKAECEFRLNGYSQIVENAYHNGILASFEFLGLDENIGQNYIDQEIITPNNQTLNLEHIMSQKYIALFAQPEVWSDFRRTGIPSLTPTSGNTIPVRLPYPRSEYDLNENAPNESTVDIFTDKVGWNQ